MKSAAGLPGNPLLKNRERRVPERRLVKADLFERMPYTAMCAAKKFFGRVSAAPSLTHPADSPGEIRNVPGSPKESHSLTSSNARGERSCVKNYRWVDS